MRLAVVIFTLLVSTIVQAANQVAATGSITHLRTQTNHHINLASHGELIFKLSGGHHSECPWLSIGDGNDVAVSVLLSAQAQGKEIKVWYYHDVKSDAWGSACKVANISLLGN